MPTSDYERPLEESVKSMEHRAISGIVRRGMDPSVVAEMVDRIFKDLNRLPGFEKFQSPASVFTAAQEEPHKPEVGDEPTPEYPLKKAPRQSFPEYKQ